MLLAEVGVPTHRVNYFDEKKNDEGLNANMELLEVARDVAQMRVVAYQ